MSVSGRGWRDAGLLIASAEAIATAIWLIPASAHIASWSQGEPIVRLVFLAPESRLAALAALALIVAGALAVWIGRRSAASLTRAAAAARPVLLLWLWAIPFMPWVPDRLPLLLVLAGPLRWVVAIVAAAWSVAVACRWTLAQRVRTLVKPRRAVFVASLVLYAGFGMYWARTVGIDGDEPHYLVIAESLLKDGDLQIENNHAQRDYLTFYANPLAPHYQTRGKNGAIYSHHAPGLPVLLLPFHALAGYQGAILMVALMGALAALAIFDVASRLAGLGPGLLTSAAICASVPFLPYAWSIFPEMPAALIAAWSLRWLLREERDPPARWFWRGVAISWLPWLHIKFSVLAAGLLTAIVWRHRRDRRAMAAIVVPFAVGGVLWLGMYFVIYGTVDPSVTFASGEELSIANIPHGVLGLLFDQKFGLLPYSPVYVLAPAGLWLLAREPATRSFAISLLAVGLVFLMSSARLYIFWGGTSAPARFLVPLLPFAAPMIAVAIERLQGLVARSLIPVWIGITVTVGLAGVARPFARLLFSEPHDYAAILKALHGGSPLPFVAPTFTEPDWLLNLPALGAWLLAAGLAVSAALVFARIPGGVSRAGIAAVASAAFLVGAAVTTAAPSADVRRATVEQGALGALREYDTGSLRAVEYPSMTGVTETRFRELTVVPLKNTPAVRGTTSTLAVDLPPGVYAAHAWFTSRNPQGGELRVVSRRAVFGRAEIQTNPAAVIFRLPVTARGIVLQVEGASAGVERLTITPQAVVPVNRRERWPVRAIENVEGRSGGYLVYTDPNAYLEGGKFWSRGTEATQVYVAPEGGSRMTVSLTNGPVPSNVEVTIGGVPQVLAMRPHDSRDIAIDLAPSHTLVPLRLQSSARFQPIAAGLSPDDDRDLGCHARVVVD